MIARFDMPNMLEFEPTQVPAPKTHYKENPYWIKYTVIFELSKSRIRKSERCQID